MGVDSLLTFLLTLSIQQTPTNPSVGLFAIIYLKASNTDFLLITALKHGTECVS